MSGLALVTGASSGIGRALALELASLGFDPILVARDKERLETLRAEIRKRHGRESRVIAEDLTDRQAPSRIADALKGERLAILVNNAGFGVHGDFLSTDLHKELGLVELQIPSLLRLTKLFLPAMVASKSGRILNVASVYSFSPVPFQSVYSATKAFQLSFSESLASELAPHGITVTALCPGITQSEFRERAGIRAKRANSGMTAEAVAAYGCRACLKGKRVAVPGLVNQVFVFVVRHLPSRAISGLLRLINQLRGVNHSQSRL